MFDRPILYNRVKNESRVNSMGATIDSMSKPWACFCCRSVRTFRNPAQPEYMELRTFGLSSFFVSSCRGV